MMEKSRIIFIASILALLIPLNSFAQKSVSVRIGNLIVADRNVGTKVPQGGVALNYTNDTTHADHKNLLFKGDYYTWDKAKNACPSGWRLPTKDELDVIKSKMKLSNGTACLEDGAGNKCYFPLSGASYRPSLLLGGYWSSFEDEDNGAWYLHVNTSSIDKTTHFKSLGHSVRCVKTVE